MSYKRNLIKQEINVYININYEKYIIKPAMDFDVEKST